MYLTFRELIDQTARKLSMYPGTSGVQLYAEDRIALYIQDKFDMIFDEVWWDDYMRWFERELDGEIGITTEAIEGVRRFDDIKAVFADARKHPLPLFPGHAPPQVFEGNTPRFVTHTYNPDFVEERIFQIVPKTSVGNVYVNARVHPGEFTVNDTVRMDPLVLTSGAAYAYAEDDGHNPGQIQKFQTEFETRLDQLKKMTSNQPISMDPRYEEYPTEWYPRWF